MLSIFVVLKLFVMVIKEETVLDIRTPYEMFIVLQKVGDYTRFNSTFALGNSEFDKIVAEDLEYGNYPDLGILLDVQPDGVKLISSITYHKDIPSDILEKLTVKMEDTHTKCLNVLIEEANVRVSDGIIINK